MTLLIAPAGYSGTRKFLHWLIVALLIAQYIFGWTMPHIGRNTPVTTLISLHFIFGVIILAVAAVRLAIRVSHDEVPPAAGLPPWQTQTAWIVYWLLYAMLFVVPILGWLNASYRGMPIAMFGIELPKLLAARAAGLDRGAPAAVAYHAPLRAGSVGRRFFFSPRRGGGRKAPGRKGLRLQLGIPIEIIEPAFVQIVRREQPAVAVQVMHRRLERHLRGPHPCASFGVRLPLRRLHGEQAATTLSQVVCPPRERGTMWSKVRSSRSPQYWQEKRSRRNTLNRVKAGWVEGFT